MKLYKFWCHSHADHKRSVINEGFCWWLKRWPKIFFHTLCSFSATAQPWYCMRHQNPPPCKTGKKNLRIQLAPAHDQDVLFCSLCVSNPQQSLESHHQLVFLVISGETLSSDEWRSKTTGENKIVSCPAKARCNVQSAALVIPYMLQGTRNCGTFQPAVVQT